MHRPSGVVVISVLYWIGACILALMGGILLIGSTVFGTMATGMQTLLAGFGTIGGIVLLGIGAIIGFIGYSLFLLREWARVTVIVFAGIAILGVFLSFANPVSVGIFGRLLRLAVNVVIVWYLVQPRTKAAFSR